MIDRFNQEIENALSARQAGNEGKARVCARRAAGLAAAEYLHQRGIDLSGPSAYDHLRRLQSLADKPETSAPILERLLMRVNTDFALPNGVDLIEDAHQLRRILKKAAW
jgi:hypothetical protein